MRTSSANAYRAALSSLIEKRGRGSVTEIAIEVGISQPQLSRIVRGEREAKLPLLEQIASALDTTVEDMIRQGLRLLGQQDHAVEIIPGNASMVHEHDYPVPLETYRKFKELFRHADKEARATLIAHVDLCHRLILRFPQTPESFEKAAEA